MRFMTNTKYVNKNIAFKRRAARTLIIAMANFFKTFFTIINLRNNDTHIHFYI